MSTARATLAAATLALPACALAQSQPPIETLNPQRWSLNLQVDWVPYEDGRAKYNADGVLMSRGGIGEWANEFGVEFVEVKYPLPQDTAGHATKPDSVRGGLRVRQVTLSDAHESESANGADYGVWRINDLDGGEQQITLVIDLEMTCWETRLDEGRAASIGWPRGVYPDDAAPFLLPDRWITSDDDRIRDLAAEWVGQGGATDPPIVVAKRIAAGLMARYTVQEYGYQTWTIEQTRNELRARKRIRNRREIDKPRMVGFTALPAAEASESERFVDAFEFTMIYVAVCRAAGIPSRLVVGLDQTEDMIQNAQLPIIRPWAEIYLYDEPAQEGWWIPADVVRERELASKPPPTDQPWQFFGNHEHLDETLPVATALTPQGGVQDAYVPALWGWNTGPTPVPALSAEWVLRFSATHTPIRSRAD